MHLTFNPFLLPSIRSLFLYNIARGIDLEPVTVRLVAKNIGCSKRFPGISAIRGLATLQHWLGELAGEICERLAADAAENNRRPRSMTVSYTQADIGGPGREVSSTRTTALTAAALADANVLAAEALDVIRRNTEVFLLRGAVVQQLSDQPPQAQLNNAIKLLGISAGKFECASDATNSIRSMFSVQKAKAEQRLSDVAVVDPKMECNTYDAGQFDDDSVVEDPHVERVMEKLDTIRAGDGDTSTPTVPNKFVEKSSKLKAFFPVQTKPTVWSTLPDVPTDAAPSCSKRQPQPTDNRVGFFASMAKSNAVTKKPPLPMEDLAESTAYLNETKEEPHETRSTAVPQYMTEYAEFQVPAVVVMSANADRNFAGESLERCPTCERNVAAHEMQSHSDAHLAFRISQQQRLEFRNQNPNESTRPTIADRNSEDDDDNHDGGVHLCETTSVPESGDSSISDATTSTGDEQQPFERCEQCNRKVALHELQSHADAHFAFRISQEQRHEYRSKIEAASRERTLPLSANKQPAAKRTRLTATTTTSTIGAGQKSGGTLLRLFMSQQSQHQQTDVADVGDDCVSCPDCPMRIPGAEMQLHADYHTARRLQRELNGGGVTTSSLQSSPASNATNSRTAHKAKVKSVREFFRASGDASS